MVGNLSTTNNIRSKTTLMQQNFRIEGCCL